jgi:hypothetical protein
MRPPAVAEAVLAVVSLPRGIHATTLELQPEAPIEPIDGAIEPIGPAEPQVEEESR